MDMSSAHCFPKFVACSWHSFLYSETSTEALCLLEKKLKFSVLTVVQLGICWPEMLEQLTLLSMLLS